ncbi:isochorismatase family protein [Planctomicrobium sp. SH668]|uniref:isochorismatase family protein n=1 Tax=Planctomicrobium sp. SH668 TaxID=3448126 RepID=UPI003F5CBBEC
MSTALLVIDIQNDYFKGGQYPLHEPDAATEQAVKAIKRARKAGYPVILVQHIEKNEDGKALFFAVGTSGAEIHPAIRDAAPDAVVIQKHFADSFRETTLEETLKKLQIKKLLVCGMMTHICVTHTSLSPWAANYDVTLIGDACASIDPVTHGLASWSLGVRLPTIEAAAVGRDA